MMDTQEHLEEPETTACRERQATQDHQDHLLSQDCPLAQETLAETPPTDYPECPDVPDDPDGRERRDHQEDSTEPPPEYQDCPEMPVCQDLMESVVTLDDPEFPDAPESKETPHTTEHLDYPETPEMQYPGDEPTQELVEPETADPPATRVATCSRKSLKLSAPPSPDDPETRDQWELPASEDARGWEWEHQEFPAPWELQEPQETAGTPAHQECPEHQVTAD